MDKIEKVIYRSDVTSTGGRDGRAISADKKLELKLAVPKEMGGNGDGTNPEQIFAAGYSACFLGAMRHVAGVQKLPIPEGTKITGKVGIGAIPQGFGIEVELVIALPGMDPAAARALVDKAHEVCPYSNATRGNIEVKLTLA